MKCYIVDDELSVVRFLSGILEGEELWLVVGSATRPDTALDDIVALRPDIVFMDLLMPDMDGIRLVQRIKASCPEIRFIMISQASEKDMIAEAYKAGIEFYIRKPINIVEVQSVTRRVVEIVNMEKAISDIRYLVSDEQMVSSVIAREGPLKSIKYLLGVLGMLGERGTRDILALCDMIMRSKSGYNKDSIIKYSQSIDSEGKIVKQRMRRAMKKGLTNIALMGLDDMANEVFQNYSQIVYDYDAIKSEMDYLRDKSLRGGKVSIDKFMEGLLIYHEVDG